MHVMPSWARDTAVLAPDAPLPIDRPFTAAEATRLGVPSSLRHRLVDRGLLRPLVRGVFVLLLSFRLRKLRNMPAAAEQTATFA